MLVTRRLRLLLLIKFKGEEVMSILIDETTPIIVQGYTGDKAALTAYVNELCVAFRAAIPTAHMSFDLAGI